MYLSQSQLADIPTARITRLTKILRLASGMECKQTFPPNCNQRLPVTNILPLLEAPNVFIINCGKKKLS